MSIRPIQIALLSEAIMNIYGVAAIYADPGSMLVLMLPASTIQTAAMRSQVQWVAALTLGITPAVLLCIPDRLEQTAARRMLYTAFMGFEACMVGTALAQYLSGNSGFTDASLFGTMALFMCFTFLRIFFLYIKPSWIEGHSAAGKTKLK